jgi:inhibitor of KinA sporulation pathway (predicted exonuclease)
MHELRIVDVAVRSDFDAFEQFIYLFVRQLLSYAREDVTQLAQANVAAAVLVEHLETSNEFLCADVDPDTQKTRRARTWGPSRPITVRSIEDALKSVKVDCDAAVFEELALEKRCSPS